MRPVNDLAVRPERTYDLTGSPTLAAFHRDDSFVRGVMGPIGSGKSVCCCLEILMRAARQKPDRNGIRHSRFAAIRQTYPELKSTTIETWKQWCPAPVVYGAPITSRVRIGLPDGTRIDLQMVFLAMQLAQDVKKLLSLELTGAWLNEAREIPRAVVDGIQGRVGRYPAKIDGGPTWSGVIMDTNPPPEGHWYHELAEKKQPDGHRYFRQPGALLKIVSKSGLVRYIPNPVAENIRNHTLGYTYYLRQVPGKDPDWINVYLLGEYGHVFTGRPVYEPWWRPSFHLADGPLDVYKGLPLYFGFDFGLTPACVAFQVTPRGQARVLREWCCADGGLRQFCQRQVLPDVAREFGGLQLMTWGDPAGSQRSQVDELTCIGELNRLGFNARPAPSNDFTVRRDAVIGALGRVVDGLPGLVVDRRCTMIVRGFNGGYQFARSRTASGEDRFLMAPEKNEFSHPHEALQYGIEGAMSPEGAVSARAQNRVELPVQGQTWGGAV